MMKQVHTAIKPNAAPGFMYIPILIYTLSFKRLQHSSIVYRYLRAEVCVYIYIYIYTHIIATTSKKIILIKVVVVITTIIVKIVITLS